MRKNISNDENAWIVQVYEEGTVKKKRFDSEVEATAWAANFAREVSIKAGSDFNNLTFGDMLDRYAAEEASKRVPANYAAVLRKIKYFKNKYDSVSGKKAYPIIDRLLIELNKNDFIAFRDRRLLEVGAGTFLREWSLFNTCMTVAANEWAWIHKNCMKGIRRPREPEHRKRRPTECEIKAICRALDYEIDGKVKTNKHLAAICFLFSLETAMRVSEITALKKHEVFLEEGYIKITGEEPLANKTRSAIRDVPLTREARRLIEQALDSENNTTFVFKISTAKLSTIFIEAKKKANVVDLKFHDGRHEGITRLARIYKVLDLAKIIGHREIDELMTYYNPSIQELVSRMNQNVL